MNDKVMASFKEQSEKLVAPMVELGRLNVASLEKLANLELQSLRAVTDLGLAQLKSAMELRDVEGVKTFAEQQSEFVRRLNEQLVEDGKAVVEIAKSYNADLQKLAQESVDAVAQKAA